MNGTGAENFELRGMRTRRVQPHPTRDLLNFFAAEYFRKFQLAAPITWKKDSALAARLLAQYSPEQLHRFVRCYFEVPDHFIRQSGYTFGVFSACIGKVMLYATRASSGVTPAQSKQFVANQKIAALMASGVPRAEAIQRVNREMGW
jgi:hypothetical protein